MIDFPKVARAAGLSRGARRVYVGAYGFEERALGWVRLQPPSHAVLVGAAMFHYRNPKGRNRIAEMDSRLRRLGVRRPAKLSYDCLLPERLEDDVCRELPVVVHRADEVVLDISAMTKLLILVCLSALRGFPGALRIVYSEAEDYAPTRDEYENSKHDMSVIARFPSRGVQAVIRTRSLSSIRMQGQPVTLIAFTSFNEQLVRHMLGTLSPHRLIFLSSRPPRSEYAWRECAAQEIHRPLIQEYAADNPVDGAGLLRRCTSTLDYRDTFAELGGLYNALGAHERLICAATGAKMQTVGLHFAKQAHPDLHVEYPTPDSYFVKGLSTGVRTVHEVFISAYKDFLGGLARARRRLQV